MSKKENEEEGENEGWIDWFEEAAGFWIGVAVIGSSLVVPAVFWIATKFFGWEPPEFINEWIDYFGA
ncbi:MAG: hypothetical protein K8U03_21690 [Planctomycetia bacterium]|nr:hypothetical protein [Planctomycetia bacterium]